jgi:type IV pilus assembly protein PilM
VASGAVVGLDIGTFAVRAAELNPGRNRPSLNRFAQVTLPPGAVVSGEVVDVAAVSAAIKRLWEEGGFAAKKVVVGLSSQRAIVRQAEVADMPEEDLRSSLRFDAHDLIPIPMDDALVDSSVLERDDGGDDPKMRILLAAVPRDVVTSLLQAVTDAGLTATAVDVQSLALLRALPPEAAGQTEAIVSIGAALTTIAIRENGIPRFVRVVNIGGESITAAIAEDVSCDLEYAEHLKRHALVNPATDGDSSATLNRASHVVHDRINPLVDEIRGSLDFYLAQADVERIERIVVTGGALRTPGLLDRLSAGLNEPVTVADPLADVEVGSTELTPAQLDAAGPLLLAPIGLALAGIPGRQGVALSLLPDEVAEARRHRRQVVSAGLGVAVFFSVLAGGWTVRHQQMATTQHKVATTQRAVVRLQGQIAALADVSTAQLQLKSHQQQAQTVLNDDLDHVRLIEQVSGVMPEDVWLTSVTVQKGTPTTPGTVNFSVSGLNQDAVVRWIQQVSSIPGLTNLWVPTETKAGEGPAVIVTFSSTANITADARSGRAAQIAGSAK